MEYFNLCLRCMYYYIFTYMQVDYSRKYKSKYFRTSLGKNSLKYLLKKRRAIESRLRNIFHINSTYLDYWQQRFYSLFFSPQPLLFKDFHFNYATFLPLQLLLYVIQHLYKPQSSSVSCLKNGYQSLITFLSLDLEYSNVAIA